MIITLEYFNLVTGDYNTDIDEFKLKAIGAAQDIIESHLGYKIEATNYDLRVIPYSNRQVKLPVPIISISTIEGINCQYWSTFNFIHFDDVVYGKPLRLVFQGGLNPIPASVQMACVEIASLKLAEKGLQVAYSGLQMTDGMGFQKYNYTNFEKFLKPLESYRII